MLMTPLAQVSAQIILAETEFEEASTGATSFTPGPGDSEIGWALTTPDVISSNAGVASGTPWTPTDDAGNTPSYTIASPSNTQVFNFTQDFGDTATLTFDNVTGLGSSTGKEVSVVWIPTGWTGPGAFDSSAFESSDTVQIFVDVVDGGSPSTLTLFDSTASANGLNDVSSGTAFRTDSLSLADTVTEAQVRIEFGNVNFQEAAAFDSVKLTAVPEPGTAALLSLGFGALFLCAGRRRRC